MKKLMTLIILTLLFGNTLNCRAQLTMDPNEEKLIMACLKGDAQQIKTLVASGVNVNAKNPGGLTPLMTAVYADKLDIVKTLLELGADTEVQDVEKATAIYKCVSPQMMTLLLNAKANYNYVTYKDRFNVLSYYAGSNNGQKYNDIVKAMIDFGVPVQSANPVHKQPLFEAVEANNLEMVKILVAAGADPHYITKQDGINLMFAATSPEMVHLLHSLKVNPNIINKHNHTPLALAHVLVMLKAFLEIGGDPNLVINEDSPIFVYSIFVCDEDIKSVHKLADLLDTPGGYISKADAQTIGLEGLRLLLNAPIKADVNLILTARKKVYFTALDLAINYGFDKSAAYLKANGAKTAAELGK